MIERFVGIRYANRGRDIETGLDCWGLLRAFYKDVLDIELPTYENAYQDSNEMNQTVQAIRYEKRDDTWVKVTSPAYGDGVLLRIAGHPCHVGIYLGDGRMLHTLTGHDSAIDCLDSVRWKNRVDGYFRHASRIEKFRHD